MLILREMCYFWVRDFYNKTNVWQENLITGTVAFSCEAVHENYGSPSVLVKVTVKKTVAPLLCGHGVWHNFAFLKDDLCTDIQKSNRMKHCRSNYSKQIMHLTTYNEQLWSITCTYCKYKTMLQCLCSNWRVAPWSQETCDTRSFHQDSISWNHRTP